jgi:hypothetical protein
MILAEVKGKRQHDLWLAYERSGQAFTRPSYTVTFPKLTSSEPSTMYPSLFEALYHDLIIVS